MTGLEDKTVAIILTPAMMNWNRTLLAKEENLLKRLQEGLANDPSSGFYKLAIEESKGRIMMYKTDLDRYESQRKS